MSTIPARYFAELYVGAKIVLKMGLRGLLHCAFLVAYSLGGAEPLDVGWQLQHWKLPNEQIHFVLHRLHGVFSQSLISWIIQKGNDLLLAIDGIEDDSNDTPLSSSSMVQRSYFHNSNLLRPWKWPLSSHSQVQNSRLWEKRTVALKRADSVYSSHISMFLLETRLDPWQSLFSLTTPFSTLTINHCVPHTTHSCQFLYPPFGLTTTFHVTSFYNQASFRTYTLQPRWRCVPPKCRYPPTKLDCVPTKKNTILTFILLIIISINKR